MEVQAVLRCPECQSEKFFKDGVRKLSNGQEKQRYVCRVCGYRYTEHTSLNSVHDNSESSQIGAKAKNLVFAQKTQICAEDAKIDVETKGALTQFYAYMEKEAYSDDTSYPYFIKRLVRLGAKLSDPEDVKAVIAKMTYKDKKTGETKKVTNGTKAMYCAAYGAFATMLKIQWENPGYRQEEHEVYVPYETELDALINAARSRRMAAYLQCLKETYADPGEVLRIRWKDIDEKQQTIKINYPVKNHNSGTMLVTPKLLSMLSALPHKHERVFSSTYTTFRTSFYKLRRRVAAIQCNPRILSVELRGFRHFGGTKIAFETNGNALEVKRLLRHKSINSTMKYIGKIDFKTDDFDTTSATSLEDILRLGSTGWTEYSIVKINGVEHHCFKKPKRFQQV